MIGFKFYPPKGTVYCELLELTNYNIGVHRGSFLLDAGKAMYKPKTDIDDCYIFVSMTQKCLGLLLY